MDPCYVWVVRWERVRRRDGLLARRVMLYNHGPSARLRADVVRRRYGVEATIELQVRWPALLGA